MKNIEGIFESWGYDRHCVFTKDHRLWTANGFMFFRDYETDQPFLAGLTLLERYRLWRELKRELRIRCLASIDSYMEKP